MKAIQAEKYPVVKVKKPPGRPRVVADPDAENSNSVADDSMQGNEDEEEEEEEEEEQQYHGRNHKARNNGGGGGYRGNMKQHMTIGGPPDYTHNRHHVDGDEQYIVEMITKDEIRRKVESDLKQKEQDLLQDKHQSYVDNIQQHQQQNMSIMQDIIQEMQIEDHQYTNNANQHYYQ